MKCPFYIPLVIFLSLTLASLLKADSWVWHNFPGQDHLDLNLPGSEVPYRGYDRSEWISAFGVSPVISEGHEAPLMLMVTDLGGVTYCEDGEAWLPADLPYNGGIAVGFNPHDGDVGYAMAHKILSPARAYLFRTEDRGKTWERLTSASYFRVQRNMIAVNPDPEQREHIYIATLEGVKRSLDNGETWAVVPETSGLDIRTLRFNADGSSLYIINGPVRDEELELGDIHLFRMDFTDNSGNYSWTQVREQDARDIHPHPTNPDRAIILTRFSRFFWTEDRGATNGQEITPSSPRISLPHYSLINPANPDHILAFGSADPPTSYYWSTDGGNTWNNLDQVTIDGVDYYSGLVDSSPFRHGTPNALIPVIRHASIIEGKRFVVGFWPGKPDWVVTFGMTQEAKGPYLSKDYGRNFQPFGWGGQQKKHNTMAIGSTDDIMAIGRVEYGVVFTNNGGLWWESRTPFNDDFMEEIHDASSNPNWTKSTFHGIGIDPEDDDHWIGFYGHGPAWIIRSRDRGQTWEKVQEDVDYDLNLGRDPWCRSWVYWHRQDPNIIYCGAWKSTDRGETWSRIPGNHAVTDISPTNGDVVLFRDFGEYFFSRDAGETWHSIPLPERDPVTSNRLEIPDGRAPGIAAIDPDPLRDPGVEGQYLRFLIGGREGVLEFNATNQDATEGVWTLHTDGISTEGDKWLEPGQATYLGPVAIDPRPGHHHIAYVAAGRGFLRGNSGRNDNHYRQVYRSEDGGITWNRIVHDIDVNIANMPNYMETVGAIQVSPNTGKLYVHTWDGMYVFDSGTDYPDWMGYLQYPSGWVDTVDWLGPVNTLLAPWIWFGNLGRFGYHVEDTPWFFLPNYR